MKRILDKKNIAGFYIKDTSDEIVDLSETEYKTFTDSKGLETLLATDSEVMPGKKVNDRYEFYIVETVTDKEINSRFYDNDAVKDSSVNGAWVKPIGKPIISDHQITPGWDNRTVTVYGRTIDSYFVEHSSKRVAGGSLPTPVRDSVLDNVNGGKGSSIIKVDFNKNGAKEIADKTMRTFSQGSIYNKATCNICGEDYIHGDCEHYIGRTYSLDTGNGVIKKRCTPTFKDRVPRECSKTQLPANDTSVLYAYDTIDKVVVDVETLDEEKLFVSISNTNNDSINDTVQNDENKLNIGENFSKNNNDDTKTNDKENKGGKTKMTITDDARDRLYKKNTISNMELRLEKVFDAETIEKVKGIAKDTTDFETLETLDALIDIFSGIKKENIVMADVVATTLLPGTTEGIEDSEDDTEAGTEDSIEDSTEEEATEDSEDDALTADQWKKKYLDAKKKLKKHNNDSSNSVEDGETEDEEDEASGKHDPDKYGGSVY